MFTHKQFSRFWNYALLVLNMLLPTVSWAEQASDLISIFEIAEVDRNAPETYNGGILAAGDVNADGFDDLIIGIQSTQTDYPDHTWNSKSILLIYDPGLKKYVPSKAFQAEADRQIWPRRAIIYDFDGNGYGDIFIAGHGTDGMGMIHCGDRNSLIFSKGDSFKSATLGMPAVSDYSHGLVSGFFNEDSVKDLLVLNSPFIEKTCPNDIDYTNKSYVLDGAKISASKKIVLSGLKRFMDPKQDADLVLHGKSADLNNDGVDDIIVGGQFSVQVFESAGQGKYKRTAVINPPNSYYSLFDSANCLSDNGVCFTPYSAVSEIDIDGDGQQEIVASFLNQRSDGGWAGQYFQVLQFENGEWMDATSKFIKLQGQKQYGNGIWCNELFAYDVDHDGTKDLICSALSSGLRPFWINKGGILTQAPNSRETENISYITPVKLGDQHRLVGLEWIGSDTLTGLKVHLVE